MTTLGNARYLAVQFSTVGQLDVTHSLVHHEQQAYRGGAPASRLTFLGLAIAWSAVAVVVLLSYHVAEPLGMKSITTNGHTYFGNPPALTLFQRDPVSFVIIVLVLGVGVLASTVDMAIRVGQRTTRAGGVAIGAGVLVFLISFFGLLVGVASIGVVGILLVLSGLPARR
jgi:hypothetical protein